MLSDIDENRETVGDQIKEKNDYIWKNNVNYVANRDFKCKLIAVHERTNLEQVPLLRAHSRSCSICKNFYIAFSLILKFAKYIFNRFSMSAGNFVHGQ